MKDPRVDAIEGRMKNIARFFSRILECTEINIISHCDCKLSIIVKRRLAPKCFWISLCLISLYQGIDIILRASQSPPPLPHPSARRCSGARTAGSQIAIEDESYEIHGVRLAGSEETGSRVILLMFSLGSYLRPNYDPRSASDIPLNAIIMIRPDWHASTDSRLSQHVSLSDVPSTRGEIIGIFCGILVSHISFLSFLSSRLFFVFNNFVLSLKQNSSRDSINRGNR